MTMPMPTRRWTSSASVVWWGWLVYRCDSNGLAGKKKGLPWGGEPVIQFYCRSKLLSLILLKQLHRHALNLVGLLQYRDSRLHQNIVAREVRRFCRHIGIPNARVRSRQVLVEHG